MNPNKTKKWIPLLRWSHGSSKSRYVTATDNREKSASKPFGIHVQLFSGEVVPRLLS